MGGNRPQGMGNVLRLIGCRLLAYFSLFFFFFYIVCIEIILNLQKN